MVSYFGAYRDPKILGGLSATGKAIHKRRCGNRGPKLWVNRRQPEITERLDSLL